MHKCRIILKQLLGNYYLYDGINSNLCENEVNELAVLFLLWKN